MCGGVPWNDSQQVHFLPSHVKGHVGTCFDHPLQTLVSTPTTTATVSGLLWHSEQNLFRAINLNFNNLMVAAEGLHVLWSSLVAKCETGKTTPRGGGGCCCCWIFVFAARACEVIQYCARAKQLFSLSTVQRCG